MDRASRAGRGLGMSPRTLAHPFRFPPSLRGASAQRSRSQQHARVFPTLESPRILPHSITTVRALRSEPSVRHRPQRSRPDPPPVRSIDTVNPDVDEGPGCIKIEHCRAGTAPRSSSSPRANRHSSPARASRTIRSAARRVGQRPSEHDPAMARASSIPRSAASAGARPWCRSPRATTDRSIAARASTRFEPPLRVPSRPDPRRSAIPSREAGWEEVGFSIRAG